MKPKTNWINDIQHVVFRVVSMAFSVVTAHAVHWFFGGLDGVDQFQAVITVVLTVAFAVLGYFVTRGLAYRLMNKLPIRSYAVIGSLYLLVEVVCNYGEAAARFPSITWLHSLSGIQLQIFTFLVPLVLSIIPLFIIAMAWMEMDLMQESSGVPAGMVKSPSPIAFPGTSGYQKGYQPQGKGGPIMPPVPAYPSQPGMLGGVMNGVSKAARQMPGARMAAMSNGNGQPLPPQVP